MIHFVLVPEWEMTLVTDILNPGRNWLFQPEEKSAVWIEDKSEMCTKVV